MSNETKNIALVRLLVTEIQENGKFELIDQYCHPKWVDSTPKPGFPPTREGVHMMMRYLHTALSEIKVDIEQCVCTGDVVATNKVLSGKQVGELFGQPATNQRVQLRVMDFMRVHDGKLIEHWGIPGHVEPVSSTT